MKGCKTVVRGLIIGSLCMALFSVGILAQTLTNQGSMIYMAPGALMVVNGTMNVNSAGTVIAEDSSTMTVNGTLNISNGSVSLNKSAYTLVTQDVITGGSCGNPTGRLLRNLPGILDIDGYLTNNGDATNYSTINVGKDWNNNGSFANKPGALLVVSAP